MAHWPRRAAPTSIRSRTAAGRIAHGSTSSRLSIARRIAEPQHSAANYPRQPGRLAAVGRPGPPAKLCLAPGFPRGRGKDFRGPVRGPASVSLLPSLRLSSVSTLLRSVANRDYSSSSSFSKSGLANWLRSICPRISPSTSFRRDSHSLSLTCSASSLAARSSRGFGRGTSG